MDIKELILSKISKILFEEDPMGINFDENEDEYDTEARLIAEHLRGGESIEDVTRIVHEVFCTMFNTVTDSKGKESVMEIAGPVEKYTEIGRRIHDIQFEIRLDG